MQERYTQNELDEHSPDIQRVIAFVDKYRHDNKIPEPVNTGRCFETSCIGYPGGEFANLIETQLVHTQFPYGGWAELKDKGVREGVIEYIDRVERIAAAKE